MLTFDEKRELIELCSGALETIERYKHYKNDAKIELEKELKKPKIERFLSSSEDWHLDKISGITEKIIQGEKLYKEALNTLINEER